MKKTMLNPVFWLWFHSIGAVFWFLFLVPMNIWWSDNIRLINNLSVIALAEAALAGLAGALAQLQASKAT